MGTIQKNINLTIAAVLILGAGIPIINASFTTDYSSVTDELFDSSGTLSETFQVPEYGKEVVSDSETVYFVNTTGDSSETELTDSNSQINWDYDNGEFTVESTDLTVDSGDQYKVSYDYKPTNYASGITAVMLNFVAIGPAIALLMIAFSGFMA